MILLKTVLLSLLLSSCALATPLQPLHLAAPGPYISVSPPPDALLLLPRARSDWITTQSTAKHVTWGKYAITIWQSTALLPVVAAAQPLQEFYQKATLAAIQAVGAKLVTSRYVFGLGSLKLYIDTLDGSPVDWDMVISFAGRMVGAAKTGWTDHYAAVVKDKVSGALTAISLQAAGGTAVAWLSGGSGVEQFKNDPFAN